MTKLLALSALPAFALLAACGGNDITLTNDNNVVLNDAQANYASVNDGEVPADNASVEDGNIADNSTAAYGSNENAPQ